MSAFRNLPQLVTDYYSTRKNGRPKTMSPGNYIRLSPGEEARLKHDENRKQKLARLQQVREQERILASEHRKLYQTVAESELGHVLNLLEKDWTASRRQKINQLKNVQDKQKQLLGQAHRTAELVAADEHTTKVSTPQH
ncbi:uncharacterized protein EV422DRAFT_404688 [Fimicolochytrium jonesii]|uniref:uncharacterized protein n=1 Tax=Fimicolochytrium jonesii TaxID=1396493 RepID=UPI0022FEA4FC|nr:uncharacterized protein EV422DRAFT_404688 [Fimicolochytrium jonesii]KAI8822581.1 hypothetical protein EV422DRAFT_404688 [Fimicolochytrium jonesii]